MPASIAAFTVFFVLALFFKLSLLVIWTRRLYDQHKLRHSFWGIFGRLLGLNPVRPFGVQNKSDMDPELWRDFATIQRMNLISSLVIVLLGMALGTALAAMPELR